VVEIVTSENETYVIEEIIQESKKSKGERERERLVFDFESNSTIIWTSLAFLSGIHDRETL